MKKVRDTISVIMSAYNEERTVGDVLKKLKSLEYINEIVITDNGSYDNTYQILEEASKIDDRIQIIRIKKNRGLGVGLRAAIKQTTGDIVIRQDADLEYDPDDMFSLVEQLQKGNADVVYGSRMLVRKAHKVHYFYNLLANKLLSFLNNTVTNLFLSDVETASKAFDGKLLRSLNLRSKGFEIENELTIKMKKIGCTFYEVPISYYGRTYGEGKKIRPLDGFKIVFWIFYYFVVTRFMKTPEVKE